MEEQIKNVIEKIIMKKYPVITGVDNVRDVFDNLGKQHSSFLGWKYVIELYTSECLSSKMMMEIDTEIKSLFQMMGINGNYVLDRTFKTPAISAFFDCGDGQGFQFSSSYGYKH
jgi:hypothetical protein